MPLFDWVEDIVTYMLQIIFLCSKEYITKSCSANAKMLKGVLIFPFYTPQ